jgi:glycerol transport system ATP-binding protein
MTVTLENVTRSVDGIPAIRDVSLTLERGRQRLRSALR